MSDYGNIEWMKGIRYGEVIAWLEKQAPIDEEVVLKGVRKTITGSIIDFLDANTTGMDMSSGECMDLEDAILNSDWLKVYRYMRKKLEKQGEQKHWKPSKKQMGTLEQWLKENQHNSHLRYCYPIFKSLYDDLKDIN